MRNFLLLVLVCVIVTESKADDVKSLLLKESIDSAKIILNNSSNEVLEQFVKDVFKHQACSEEILCRTASALKHVPKNTEVNMLRRRLYAYAVYTGHQNCTVTNAAEYTMTELLKDLIPCCKRLLQQKKHHFLAGQ